MPIIEKIKSFFSPQENKIEVKPIIPVPPVKMEEVKTNGNGNKKVKALSDIHSLTLTTLNDIFAVDPVHTIPKDILNTPISILGGLILNNSSTAILGYNLVKVNDDGSINVNVGGATITVGDLDVSIHAVDQPGDPGDSVQIFGATAGNVQEELLTVNRRLQVDAAVIANQSINNYDQYSEALAVASNATVAILTFIVPVNQTLLLQHVEVSGDNIANYFIKINGTTVAQKRTYFTEFNADFFIAEAIGEGLQILSGQTLTIEVFNFRPTTGNFNARTHGTLE